MSSELAKADWLQNPDIQPFVFVRPENMIHNSGTTHQLDWFKNKQVVYKNPLALKEIGFAEHIYSIEGRAFGPSNMAMPRWVFYDCAVLPGFVAGFCMKTQHLPDALSMVLSEQGIYSKPEYNKFADTEWTPLSLFIIIPTMHEGEWVAHNLCTVNSLLPKEHQFYGLGFLSKAFGLWYANVEQCTGMTQWGSPALKLHSHYGDLEVIGAYAPVHSHAKTVTYRVRVETSAWHQFFSRQPDRDFLEKFEATDLEIDPNSEASMIELHTKIENKQGPYFLSANEIAAKSLTDRLRLYRPKIKL